MNNCFKRKKECHGKEVVNQKFTHVILELASVAKNPKTILWSQQMTRREEKERSFVVRQVGEGLLCNGHLKCKTHAQIRRA